MCLLFTPACEYLSKEYPFDTLLGIAEVTILTSLPGIVLVYTSNPV